MTDYEFDIKERKSIARQAKYKKNGSKSKKCSLPSDGMTQKQWKERNGEVLSYNFNRPIMWEAFKGLPIDVQREYVLYLRSKYNVSMINLASMFGICKVTIGNYFHKNLSDIVFAKGSRMTGDQRAKWNVYMSAESEETPACISDAHCEEDEIGAEQDDAEECIEESSGSYTMEAPEPERKREMQTSRISVKFCGDIDLRDVMNSMRFMVGDDAYGELEISFQRCRRG